MTTAPIETPRTNEADSSDTTSIEYLLQSAEKQVQGYLESFVRDTGIHILERMKVAIQAATVTQNNDSIPDGLDHLISEVDRSLKSADLFPAVQTLFEQLQIPVPVPSKSDVCLETDHTVADVPLKEMVTRIITVELIVGLPDRLQEGFLPVLMGLLRFRGFVHSVLAREGDEADEAYVFSTDDLIDHLNGEIELLERRIHFWVAGLHSAVKDSIRHYGEKRKNPPRTGKRQIQNALDLAQLEVTRYRTALSGVAGAIEADLEGRRIELQATRVIEERFHVPSQRIREELAEAAELLVRTLKASHQRVLVAAEREDSTEALIDSIATQREQIRKRIEEDTLTLVQEVHAGITDPHAVETLRLELQRLAQQLPNTIQLVGSNTIDVMDSGHLPDSLVTVRLREPGYLALATTIPWHISTARDKEVAILAEVHERIMNVNRVVEFNLESAANEIRTFEETEAARKLVEEMVSVPLARSVDLLEKLPEYLREKGMDVTDELRTSVSHILQDFKSSIARGTQGPAAAPPAGRLLERVWDAMADGLEWIENTIAESLRKAGRSIVRGIGVLRHRIQRTVFPPLPHGVSDPEAIGRARETALPHAYRMLFATEPVSSPELLIGRDEEMNQLARSVVRIRAGFPASIAVIAPPGGGRSSFVRIARSTVLDNLPTHFIPLTHDMSEAELTRAIGQRLNIRSATSLEDLAQPIQNRREVTAVILDDLGSLFYRAPGGFRTLEALRLLITSTSDKILWVTTVSEPLWRYLVRVGRIPQAFTQTIQLAPFSPADIGKLIMSRHRLSGHVLSYGPMAWKSRVTSYFNPYSIEGSTEQRVIFDALGQAGFGNPALSVLIWRRSLGVRGDGSLEVHQPLQPDIGPIVEEDLDSQATLATLLLQRRLNPQSHAHVFGWDVDKSARTLRGLQQRGWIETLPMAHPTEPQAYQMMSSVRFQIYRFLQHKGLLL
ncbi:MAG: hypothetical protein CMH54_03560 [Myxococcales bacterium]|nr:hypothetical protein [Myxococcales bacterium]